MDFKDLISVAGYGIETIGVLPTTFIIDANGLILHRFEGLITAQDVSGVIAQSN